MGSNFFSLGDSHTKGCMSCCIWDFRLTLIQKRDLSLFKFIPTNDRVLNVYTPSGYSTREQLDRGRFFEGLQIVQIVSWVKWTWTVKIRHKDFTGTAPVMPCQKSLWIMGLRIYGEERTQILISLAKIGPLVRIQGRQGLY